jgi:hypothetical protein
MPSCKCLKKKTFFFSLLPRKKSFIGLILYLRLGLKVTLQGVALMQAPDYNSNDYLTDPKELPMASTLAYFSAALVTKNITSTPVVNVFSPLMLQINKLER